MEPWSPCSHAFPGGGGTPATGHRSLPLLWLAVAAAAAVTVTGLVGLGLGVVVVQTLDPSGGLPVSGSIALAGRLWLLAQGGRLDRRPVRSSSLRC